MYTFSNSLLEPAGNYRVETYSMQVFGYDAHIEIDLKIFGKDDYESYIAEFEIFKDGKSTWGSCLNRTTKEDTFFAVEEAVIDALNDKNIYWE